MSTLLRVKPEKPSRRRVAAAPAWPVPAATSPATRRVAELFGLPAEGTPDFGEEPAAIPAVPDLLRPGQITLLTGASGAGKSSLLRRFVSDLPTTCRAVDVGRTRLRPVACVDQFSRRGGADALPLALDLLARVGLAEATVYLRRPQELSDGQRWRLRLAVSLARCMADARRRRPTLLVADEFAAVLDRVSAATVARSLRRSVDRLARVGVRVSAAVATSHDDLGPALLPDVTIRCDFGAVTLTPTPHRPR